MYTGRIAQILVLLGGSVFSQTGSSNIVGSVTDPADRVVPNATVQLTNPATEFAVSDCRSMRTFSPPGENNDEVT